MAQAPLSPLEKLLSEQPQPQARSRGIFTQPSDSSQVTSKPSKAGEIPAELVPVIAETAIRYNVPANVIAGIASKESEFNPDALGVPTKYGRAKGIMQYLDSTAQGVGIDPYNPAQAIDAAGRQLRERLDKGYDMRDAVREHFAGPDRSGWGPKTAEYGDDVLNRAAKYMTAFGGGATLPENAPENAPAGGYTAEHAQELLASLNKDEPGRYTIATPEQIAAFEAEQAKAGAPNAMLPEAGADFDVNDPAFKGAGKSDGALSAIGKAVRNVPGNFQEAAAGQLRSFGEGIDDQTLVIEASKAGVIDRLRADGIIRMAPEEGSLIGRDVPTMPDGRIADTASIAQYLRENAQQLGLANADQANAITALGQDLGEDARKDRLEINPDGPLAKYSSMIIGSTAEMIPALVAAAITKKPSLAMGMIGGQVYGQSYERARTNKDEPQNPSEAASYAMAQAVAEAIPSAIPVHAILAPGANFFKGLFKAGVAEGLQESVTGAIQAGIDKGTIDPNMTWAQAQQQIMDSAIGGVGAGMALRGGTVGVRRAKEALRNPERDLGQALNDSVDSTELPGDAQQQAVDALDPNTRSAEPTIDQATGEIIAPAPTVQTPVPTGPLGRAMAAGQPPAPTVAAPIATPAVDAAALPEGESFAGQPGQLLEINMPGVEPFRARVDSYVDGEVMLIDEGGDRFQMTRDELASAVPLDAPVSQEQPPAETGQAADDLSPFERNTLRGRGVTDDQLLAMSTEEGRQLLAQTAESPLLDEVVSPGVEAPTLTDATEPEPAAPAVEPAPSAKAKPLEEQSEAELRESLKYLARQAKASGGWNPQLMGERRRIESAIGSAQKAAASATNVNETASDVAESASDVEKTASDVKESATNANPLEQFRPEYEAKERERLRGEKEDRILQSIQILNQFQRDADLSSDAQDADRLNSISEIKARELDELKRRGYSDEQLAEAAGLLPTIPLPKVGDKVNYANGQATVLESSERGVKVRQRGKETMLSVSQYSANQNKTADEIYTQPSWAAQADTEAPATPTPKPAKENKWFGSLAKARGYISGKGLDDSHQVVKNGGRYEIVPNAEAAPVPAEPAPVTAPVPAAAFGVDRVRGEPINDEWTAFNEKSGTTGVPRADMPQIKAEHRGAMVNFLNARGIEHQEVEVPADSLKPTQAEYSPAKVQRAKEYEGGQRAILVSRDGHVVDGHHQWLADLDMGQAVRAIQLDAPIDQVLEQLREFPSADQGNGATSAKTEPTNSLSRTASWVIRDKATGNVVMETFDRKKVEALNTDKYEAVPIAEHLASLNNEKAPVTEQQAPYSRKLVRTYTTKSGKVGAEVRETLSRDGRTTYSYSGEWGAGSGHDASTMQQIERDWQDSKRGYTVEKAGEQENNPQEKPADRPDSEINSPKKPTKKQQAEAARNKLADHFTPGNILKSAYWGTHERVEKFTPRDDGSWSVTVQTVEQRDGEWAPVGEPRTHQTAPERGDVVVERAADPDPQAKPAASANTIFTEDAAAKARAILKSKLTQLNSGIDPEILQAGITLAGYHIEKGARSFAAYAKAMTGDLGDMVKPYLKSWYMGVKYDPRAAGFTDMSTAAEVEGFDVDQITTEEPNDAPSPAERVERDRQESVATESVDAPAAGNAERADASVTGEPGADAGSQRRAGQRDNRLPADGAPAGREPGNQRLHQHNGEFRPSLSLAGGTERAGSGSDRSAGKSVERKRAKQIARNAAAAGTGELAQRVKAQKAAAKAPTTWADPTSIDKALPLLLPEQRADVLKAEIRLANANGILYTNGTGTGKTASGLGIAKRYYNDGKQDIIVVVPTDKIASDWVKFADLLGMPLKKLDGIADNGGSGPVITTYANFGQNSSLAKRTWQLVIPDESHYLSSNEDGDTTAALQQLRSLTGHHAGMHKWLRDRYSGAYELRDQAYLDLVGAQADKAPASKIAPLEQAFADANATIDRLQKRVEPRWRERWEKQENIGRVAFLSATPFAYQKNVQYAEGFLFDFIPPADLYASEGTQSQAYNAGDAYQRFMMQHFGYRMRYNKLTAPEAGVESQVMERQFNNWLKDQGALSGRRLEVPFDYDRKFVTVDDAIGTKIDDALRFLREGDDGAHRKVYDGVMSSFDHQSRMYLLEALKARAVIPMIQADLKAGRKVVVFHDYNKGGAENPFTAALRNIKEPEIKEQARKVLSRPMFKFDLSGLGSPIDTLTEAFPEAFLFNGTVSKAKRRANADRFNDDANGPTVFIAQSDAAREGVSLHDTTGQHPRVEYNLGMPTRPVAATQIEGRIYRTGQASDAMFRYLTTGTGWEASAFASKIAERASTAENLALGNESRDLRAAFIDAYNNAEAHSITPNDGKGGKAADSGRTSTLSPWQIAKSHYWAQQKNTKRRDQREGADYFATAEPIGLKKVQWADIQPGESVLEPSAGHGAIARFFPEQADVTMIEPSYDLSQRAALANGTAKIINDTFESHHITNKYAAIVMNPPFGSGGKTAIEHLTKAARHLSEGGRIVATIPRGGMADRRLEAFMADPAHANLHTVADIELPGVAFGRAGTNVATRVLVLERHAGDAVPIQPRKIDLSSIDNVNELFDRLENLELPARLPLQAKASLLDGSGTNGNRYDAASLDNALRAGALGKALAPLLDNGRLVIHQDAPAGMHALTQGWTDTEGNIHLVASQLTNDTAMPVLLHEAFHTGTDQLLGSPRWSNLMARLNQFHKAAESGSLKGEWADAYRRVQAAQAAGDQMSPVRAIEELGAYAVEHFEQAPPGIKKWVDNVLGQVKEWLSRRFGIQAGELTPAQLRAVAVAALRANRQAAPVPADEASRYSLSDVSAEALSQELRAQYPGLKLSLFGKNGRATLSRIELPIDTRNAGLGSQVMRKITDWADQTGTTLALTPSGDFGGSKPRLTDFYKRFGFVENKGKQKDYEVSESMYREPQAANRPGVRYSLGTHAPSAKATDGWFSQKLTDAMAGPKSHGQYSMLALAPMDRLVEELTRDGSSARDYLKHKRDMDAYRNAKHREFDDIAQEWLKLNINPKYRQHAEDMAILMHDATIAQLDPAEPIEARLTDAERKTLKDDPDSQKAEQIRNELEALRPQYEELRERWDKLPPRLQAQYRRVRNAYKATTEELDRIIADNLAAAIDQTARKAERQYTKELEEIRDEGLEGQERDDAIEKATKKLQTAVTKGRMNKKARLTMLRQQFEANRLRGPYFPLARFGDYFVTVRDADGKVLNFSRFESKADQDRFAQRMKGKGKVETGLLSSSQALRGAVDSRFVADIEEILGKADINDSVRDQVWQRYLESMPDMSLRKGFIHRKNREGYTQDATRAFAHKMFHSAHQMGRLKYGNQMQEAIDEAEVEARHSGTRERDQAVINELARRHDYVMNPKGGAAAQALTSAAFVYQLSMSPAAALVNMAQTFMVGVPVIGAQYGMVKTAAELGKASKDFAMGRGTVQKAKALTPDERLAMAQAYQSGLIESTQSHNLAGVGDGVGVRYSAVRNKVMGVIAWAFHQAERTNREVTYLAAYRLGRDAGQTHAQAVDSATSLTYKTHFDYGNTNRPRVMHGDTAKVMLVFRNYQVNMLWRLFRDTHQALHGDKEGQAEAIKQLAGMTGMMALNAGVKGVWLYSIAMIIASMLFGDDAEDQFKKATIEHLGPTAAGLLLNGVPGHLTGTALSERIGMPDLWFRSPDRQMEGREEFNYWQSQLLGFLPSIAQNFFTGYQQASDGNVARGLETAAPKAIKDLMRAYRYGSEGATTLRGDQIVSEFTPWELFGQAMGFTPAVLSEQYDRNNQLKNAETKIMDARSKLLAKMAVAHRTKDAELRAEALADIKAFNRDNKRVAITPSNINSSIRTRKIRGDRTEGGIYINPKLDKQLRDTIAPAIYR